MKNATSTSMIYCRIRELIVKKGRDEKRDISYRVLSAKTGLSTSTIVKLASWDGIKRIDASTIEALCDFFDCTVGDLLVYDKTGMTNRVDITAKASNTAPDNSKDASEPSPDKSEDASEPSPNKSES